MNTKTETAFRLGDQLARVLGDLKNVIYEIKLAGGVSEKGRLTELLRVKHRIVEDAGKWEDFIVDALNEVDRESQREGKDNLSDSSAVDDPHACVYCGETASIHSPGCSVLVDIDK